MLELPARVLAAIRAHHLLRRGDTVLVAVSGGADSVVLLDLLHRGAATEGWRLAVAHFHHGLRGREADADAAWVRRLARRLKLPCHVGRGDVRALARARGLSLEAAARQARHAFLAATARAIGAPKIALAHHADDQVETFLLRALRGSGSEGLAGMKWKAPSPADAAATLVRPLLGESRTALRAYAQAAGLSFREDSSNRHTAQTRNLLRRRVVPWLRRVQPALTEVVPRTMRLLAEEADYLIEVAARWLRRRRPPFAALHPAVQRRVIQLQVRAAGLEPDSELIERLRRQPGVPLQAADGLRLIRDASGRVRPAPLEPPGFPSGSPAELRLDLRAPTGAAHFAGLHVRWRIRTRKAGPVRRLRRRPGREWLDADRVGEAVTLRHWRPGDRFQPLGLPRPAKLQDLFTNAKVPRAERHQRGVAMSAGGEIIWVEGLRPGETVRLTPASQRVLEWSWSRPRRPARGSAPARPPSRLPTRAARTAQRFPATPPGGLSGEGGGAAEG